MRAARTLLAGGILLGVVAMGAIGCGPSIPGGRYSCEPGDPAGCPAGWFCRTDGRCWPTPGDGGPDDVPDVETDDAGDGEGGCDPAACDDDNFCNGEEVCTVEGECVATRPPDEGTECTRSDGVAGHCFLERCRPDTCGNGSVESGEDCDDGNAVGDDGCEPDCIFSCRLDPECRDEEPCNGEERCADHTCVPGTPLPNGSSCGELLICLRGACVTGGCGDGIVDPTSGERCDDGNDVAGDGCDNDCDWSCATAGDCDDLLLCNGSETCEETERRCLAGAPATDGTPCTDASGAAGICRAGSCAGLDCGNGTVDAGEDCDDDNTVPGDGCENDCTWTCETDPDCDDADGCNGAETCTAASHTCAPGATATDGTACDRDANPATRDVCIDGSCGLSICGDGWVDEAAGETCDDANTVVADGCENDCSRTCETDPDCDDVDVCSGTETCDTGTHICRPGSPLADDTPCTITGGVSGHCRGGACARTTCGNGTVDVGEECDDGNSVDGDGCDTTCVYSCHVAADCHESPDNPCTTDACSAGTSGQRCEHAANTEPCDDLDACTSGDVCAASTCRGTRIDGDADTYGPGAACGGDCNDANRGVHPGAAELCNAIDDDCSGTTDDGATMQCAQGSSRSCVATGPGGSCAGTEDCLSPSCTWSGICTISATETCNGTDDDCNGSTDEGFACVLGTSVACTTSCALSGTRTCGAGCVLDPCIVAEVACNACDDDADGVTDEGTWCSVGGLPATQDLFSVWGSSAPDVWVVGNAGAILRWNGTDWSSVAGGGTSVLRGVYAASATAAWAVGDGAAILRWDGTAWTPESATGVTANLRDAWGASADDVWAVGDGGVAVHRTGGAWAGGSTGITRDGYGAWGTAATDVWVAAFHGNYRRWDGRAWSGGPVGSPKDLYAIGGSATNDVWVVGADGLIRHWNGTTWSGSTSGVLVPLRGVYAASATEAWTVGDGGTLLRWDGARWSPATSGTTRILYGVWGASAADVWVVGAAGTVLRWRQ